MIIVYAAIGIHPHDASLAGEGAFQQIESLAGREKVVAIGETGLDYHYDNSSREVQQEVFRRHIQSGKVPQPPHHRPYEGGR